MATSTKATQDFVPIKEVRDGVLILDDGSMRAILMTSSVNFALKSEDEQRAIIYQFQNFLNTLDFPVQIFIKSRRLNIKPYLDLLENRKKVQTNDLMKIQIKEYMEFVRTFTENIDIMTKEFYIVIPYTPPALNISKKPSFFGKKKAKKNKIEKFEENRIQLEQRISVVEQGINRTGIRTQILGTDVVIELFYKMFNPGDSAGKIDFKQV